MMRRIRFFIAVVGMTVIAANAAPTEYQRIARISYLDGHVSFQHPGEVDWTAASVNMALQPGDRIYTGEEGRAEVEIDDGSVLHLAAETDIEILSLRDEFIQVRVMVGLLTLNLHSSIACEINTPAAAFSALRKGVYRFDVVESGNTDAIVRKGLLDAANGSFTGRVEAGELIHVTPGPDGGHILSAYSSRDAWDEWTDRRDKDLTAFDSRKYLPDSVYMGVSELDTHGHWVVVDAYGPAWVPNNVEADWNPYWVGRWWYRPVWGWTWVSYEPWGWLPYHYGRWYHHNSHGWCWLPGVSFGFHFWSPGLVRFYQGPSWVSWCPLGPGDYYNVNNYYYNPTYSYYLNNLRMRQFRGPGDLVNRNVPGAFRTVSADGFVGQSFGERGGNSPIVSITRQPWRDGSMITDRLSIPPTSRSYAPAPDRPAAHPATSRNLPPVVRTEPAVEPTGGRNGLVRIDTPPIASPPPGEFGRRSAGAVRSSTGSFIGSDSSRPGRTIERPGSNSGDFSAGRPDQGGSRGAQVNRSSPPIPNESSSGGSMREMAPSGNARRDAGGRAPVTPPNSGSTVNSPGRNDRPAPAPSNPRMNNTPPRQMDSAPVPAPRSERAAPPSPPRSSSSGKSRQHD